MLASSLIDPEQYRKAGLSEVAASGDENGVYRD